MSVNDLPMLVLLLVLLSSFASAVLHGATGMAGGIVLTAILSHIFGVRDTIVLMTFALVFSHATRVFLHRSHIDWGSVKIVLVFSAPGIGIGVIIFNHLTPTSIAAIMAIFLSLSFPIKAFAKQRKLKTSDPLLAVVGSLWGVLAGNVIGPGFVLAPFLLGRRMGRVVFVASLAVIVLSMNLLKLIAFSATGLASLELVVLGVIIGVITIPGNLLGKKILLSMSDEAHQRIINLMTMLIISNFVFLCFFPNSDLLFSR